MASKKTDIISRITIKPSSPTPPHLQTFKLSFVDQIAFHFHHNLNFFYPNNSNSKTADNHLHESTEIFHSKSKHFQKALSETLTLFFPLAGRLVDDSTVACNDEGVIFTESKTDYVLSDLLQPSPDFDLIYDVIVSTNCKEAKKSPNNSSPFLLFNFVLFGCGGTAVSVAASHKLLDLASLMTFLKSLSAACCGSVKSIITPDFQTARTLFPPREIPKCSTNVCPRKVHAASLVFTAAKIQELKTIAADRLNEEGYEFGYLSRVNLVTAFLWKCLAAIDVRLRKFFRPTCMFQPVNLRNQIGKLPAANAIGNLACSFATDTVEKESDVQFSEMLKKLLRWKASVDEKIKSFNADVLTQENGVLFDSRDDMNLYGLSSWCRFGFYDIDFGMGKPLWITCIFTEFLTNYIALLDTREEGEVEALVHLEEDVMEAFKHDQQLLQFAVPKIIMDP